MGTDIKQRRYCDECGRIGLEIKRIHAGNDYCGACYKRVFVAKACTACGGPSRAHRNDSEAARCGRCTRAHRTCLRCGVPTPRGSIKVGEAVACASCAPHFRAPRHCDACGRLSSRLSRAPKFGISAALCERCRPKLDHATCSVCRRHRRVSRFDGDKPLCPHCAGDQPQNHACPECHVQVSGGGQGACRACLNRRRLRDTAQLQAANLSRPWARVLWEQFIAARESEPRAVNSPGFVSRSLRALPFFQALETRLPDGALTKERILTAFTTAELRKHLLASRFVLAPLSVEPGELNDVSLEHRCSSLLKAADNYGHGTLLRAYAKSLEGRAARTRCRYLAAADKLCRSMPDWRPEGLDQALLDRYLAGTPGARASLFSWVTFCRNYAGQQWQVPTFKDTTGARQLSADVRTVRRLRAKLDSTPDAAVLTTELINLLAVALSVPIDRLSRSWAKGQVTEAVGAIRIGRFATLQPNHPLHRYAALLRARRPAA